MTSKLKITKKLPSYLEKSSKGGLLVGFIYVIAFMSILFLAIWQTFETENNKSSMNLIDERLSLIEEQINIVDETNNDSMTDITSSIQFLDKEIRKLWDLSNKRNKVNIATLTTELAKVNEIIASIQLVIDEVLPQLQQAVSTLNLKTANLDNLEGSTNSIAVDVQQLQRQILFIEESLQALEAYRAQNNQLLLEIQNSINNEEPVASPTSSTNE